MKNEKAFGEDYSAAEMLKLGGNLLEAIKILLTRCLEQGHIPSYWENDEIIQIYKKDANTNIENYRPINVLSRF